MTVQQQPKLQQSDLSLSQPVENVPIFALHPKGAFYVPMSVELPLIRALFNPASSTSSENAQPLLHPVTISVNFCHPLRVLTAGSAATATVNNDTTSIHHHSSVIQQPVRLTRPELLLPGLIPAPTIVHHQRHHQQYEMDPVGFPPTCADDSRLRGREHARSSLIRHHEELKMFRTPQRDNEGGYPNGTENRRSAEYAVIRAREHGTRSPAVITSANATHSSRWSHLMAKRTHTP